MARGQHGPLNKPVPRMGQLRGSGPLGFPHCAGRPGATTPPDWSWLRHSAPHFVEGPEPGEMHQQMAAVLDAVIDSEGNFS